MHLIVYDGSERTSRVVATVEEREEPTEDSDETSANARLIAAAPELLAAANAAADFLASIVPDDTDEQSDCGEEAALNDLATAIAHAEGRA